MTGFLVAALFIGIPLAAVCLADRRHHGPMPSLYMPAGERWPNPDGRQTVWVADPCGCVWFRPWSGPVYQPCIEHEWQHQAARWSR